MNRSLKIFIAVAVLSVLATVGTVMAQEPDPVTDPAAPTGSILSESEYPDPPASEMPPSVNVPEQEAASPEPVSVQAMEGNENANRPAPVPTLYEGDKPEKPAAKPVMPNASAQGELKKIEHPDLIKFFTKIRQVGNSLYGVLKNAANPAASGSSDEKPASGTDSQAGQNGQGAVQQLEKILRPDLIKFYTSIKKIGTSLFGVRIGNSGKGVAVKRPIVTAEQSACVVSAIQVKDQAVVEAKTAEAAAFGSAVSARTACQTAALGSTEGQAAALEKCVTDFTKSAAAARETFGKVQNEAWKTYVAALKVCAPSSSTGSGTSATEGADIMVEDGGNSL